VIDPEICEYCGKKFKKVASHLPYCEVRKITLLAEQEVRADGTIEIPEVEKEEIDANAWRGVVRKGEDTFDTSKFWAWTAGLGIQIGVIIDSFTGLNAELRTTNKLLEDIKANLGNTYIQNTKMIEKLSEINQNMQILATSFADAFEIIKHGEIIDEERKEEIRKASPGFEPAPQQTNEEVNAEITSYKSDDSLPEHTRKLPAKIKTESPKALLLLFFNGKEGWIPKSTIHSEYKNDEKSKGDNAPQQSFVIDSWVLKKNNIISDAE